MAQGRRAAAIATATMAVTLAIVMFVADQGSTDSTEANPSASASRQVAAAGSDVAASKQISAATSTTASGAHGHDMSKMTHSHHADSPTTYDQLPAATKAEVDIVAAIAAKYPTAADAEKAGWHKATRNLYGIAAHYLKGGPAGFVTVDSKFKVSDPEILLFDGEGSDAKIAGISYLVSGPTPKGFTGSDDVWHRHEAICFKGGLVISETEAEGSPINLTDDQCRERGGLVFPIKSLSMIHVWVGKGYSDRGPIFAHDNPRLYHGYQAGLDV